MPAPSFKTRMKAWWDGYDLPGAPATAKTGTVSPRPRWQRRCQFSAEIDTMHMIFGEGRSLPLPLDPFEGIEKPDEGQNEKNVLLIGAETGASVIHLATQYRLLVTALEPDRQRVRTAEELAEGINGGKQFNFSPVDLVNVELNENRFDLIASRLQLHRHPTRDVLYRKIERALRKLGTLSLVQFVAADDANVAALNSAMVSSLEPETPHLLSQEDEKRMLIESGLRPQSMVDVTPEIVARLGDIFGRWQEFAEQIAEYDQQPRMLQAMLAQVQHWQTRIGMLNNGDLQAIQFRSTRKPNELG
jgi:SAM-dependent methyltransferase